MIGLKDVFKIGVIGRLHGVGGEVVFRFADDVFDRVDADSLFLKIDGLLVPFFIEEYRFRNDETVLMKFERVDTEAQAHRIVGAEVYFPYSLINDDTEQSCMVSSLTGFQVEDKTAGPIGEVLSVDDTSANVLLNVKRTDGKEIQLPFHSDLVVGMNDKQRILILNLPEGLLSLND